MTRLAEEFHSAVDRVTQAQLDWLKTQGITGKIMVRVGLVGVLEHEIVIPVRTGAGVESPIIGLVSTNPRKPDHWHLWADTAPVLGAEGIEHATHYGEPLTLYGTPWTWLTSGAEGAVILDWKCHVAFWLAGVKRVLADDDETAKRLLTAISSPRPDIEIRVMERRHAA